MSINRVGTALVAAVGCLVATDLSQASAAEPSRDAGKPVQLKPVASAMKLERGRVAKVEAPVAKKAEPKQSVALNPSLKKRMIVRR